MHSNYSWSTHRPKQNNEEACLGNFSGEKFWGIFDSRRWDFQASPQLTLHKLAFDVVKWDFQ